MLDGVEVMESAQKDELILEGNDIDHVSQSGNSTRTISIHSTPSNYFPQPLPSKVFAVFVIKISGSSWMVFTYRIRVQFSQTTLKNLRIPSV